LLAVTTDAKRYQIARVERFTALGEAANVVYLELSIGSAASRTGVAVTLDSGPHRLPSTAPPQPSCRLSVALPLTLSLAAGTGPATGVLLDPLALGAEAAHRYFTPRV
jgi:hypothetical protein